MQLLNSKRILKLGLALLSFSFILTSCHKDQDDVIEEISYDEINDFIWKGLNYWYYWQPQVVDLSDAKLNDLNSYYSYLNNYATPEDLFNALIYDQKDDFSWYIEDVEEQLKQFAGTSKAYGIRLGKNLFQTQAGGDVYIYIAYIVPNSPAEAAGLKRGDVIYKVDGTIMNADNYAVINNLFNNDSITLGVGRFENGGFNPYPEEFNITRIEFAATPIQHYSVIESGGKNIGYLVYNGFKYPYHKELNDVFTYFKANNVDELILDLRYNGGGTIITAAFLASMIDGSVPQLSATNYFADLRYNSKRNAEEGSTYPFFDEVYLYDFNGSYIEKNPMTRLTSLSRLYVLTSESTASASEMIINGLRPFMPVTTIGGTTVGKNEGSITVVDSPGEYNDVDNRNPNHTIGMQPIVFQIFNKNGENDYDNGFIPSVSINEMDYATNIKDFGDPTEPFLSAAINDIIGATAKFSLPTPNPVIKVGKEIQEPKFSQEMYLIPSLGTKLK